MSDLTRREKLQLEKLFQMEDGYLLDFSNRTLSNFIFECLSIDMYSDVYANFGESKANRVRSIWHQKSNMSVGKLTLDLLEYLTEKGIRSRKVDSDRILIEQGNKIAQRLIDGQNIDEIDVLKGNDEDREFTMLANSIKDSIAKNEPEAALDRLHTCLLYTSDAADE